MRRHGCGSALSVLWLMLMAPAMCAAEEISGFVKDASGGVLPGATVTATQVGTQLARGTVTNERGYYIIPDIPIGEYDVVAELSGFKRFVEKGIVVRVNSSVAVNATLEIGAMEESVTVQASSVLVELNTGQVGRLVTGEQATTLQLNGRNFSQLLWLNPGVSSTVRSGSELFGGFGSNGTGQSINGGRTSSQSWNIDGVDNKDNGGGGNNFVNINPDAIAEFKVLTTNFSAEYGQNAGAVINLALKSGTQQLRGVGYEYLRNDRFDATAFNALVKPALRYNNFGGNVGGPVSFAGFNQNRTKLFFFAGVDFKCQRVGTPTTWTVPTAAQRNADFSALPASQWPIDPTTGQAFPNGRIPDDRISPNAKRLIANYPLPNFTGAGGNFQFNNEVTQDVNEYFVKFDYVHSASQQITVNVLHDDFGGVQNTTQVAVYDRRIPGYSSTARWKSIFGANTVNTFQASASGNTIRQDNFRSNPTFAIDITRAGNGVTYPLLYSASDKIPSIMISGSCCSTLMSTAATFQNFNHLFQFRDDLSKIVGNHNLKTGLLIMHSEKHQDNQPAINGTFTFDSLALALLGNFNNYVEGGNGREGWFRFWQHEFYVADSWKVTPRLSLDLGLRYNLLQSQYSALNNAVVFIPRLFDPSRAPLVNPANGLILPTPAYDPNNGLAVGGSSFPQEAVERGYNNPAYQSLFHGLPGAIMPWQAGIGPRGSFAYDMLGEGSTVIRGGFGRFFERIQGNYLFSNVNNPPFVSSTTIFSANVENPAGGSTRATPPNIRSFDVGMKLPTVDNWSVGVQRKLTDRAMAEVSYVGAHGFDQTRDSDLNQLPLGALQRNPGVNANALRPYPGYAFINQYVTDASFRYHSLQALFKVNPQDGGLVQLAYTRSRAITTSTDWNTLPVDSYNPLMDEGPASYDRPHVFVASYIYELPFWRSGGPWYQRTLGGWRVSGVTTLQSGLPINVVVNGDPAGIGRPGTQRPNLAGDPDLPAGERSWTQWFNTAAFTQPAAGTFGNLTRNAVRGPGTINTDLSLHKLIRVAGQRTAEFRLEMFNVFNHANPFTVNNTLGAATFGQVTAFADPRIIQIAFRFNF
jgi:outer membrane receptor protein involved in Fe transport